MLDSEARDDAAEADEEEDRRFAAEGIEEDAGVMVFMVVLDATKEEDIWRGLSDISTDHRSKGIQWVDLHRGCSQSLWRREGMLTAAW